MDRLLHKYRCGPSKLGRNGLKNFGRMKRKWWNALKNVRQIKTLRGCVPHIFFVGICNSVLNPQKKIHMQRKLYVCILAALYQEV